MEVVDTNKTLTDMTPFYSVDRDSWGWVHECTKPTARKCVKCMFWKRCLVVKKVR